ncbi:MAG: hypothetical protein AAGA08_02365 [Pseudomonadota bacterium]
MSEISQHESRITAALDRIAICVENAAAQPVAAPAPAAPDGDLVEELEIERATNARLVASKAEGEARIERLDTRVQRLTDRLEAAEGENTRLRNVIAALSENNAALREANTAHQGAGSTADAGVAAQLSDLQQARAQDMAQLDEIMAELAPALKEA